MSNDKAGNAASASRALPTETNPLDFVPDKIPFDTPYGPPISLDRAQAVIHAAVAEAKKRSWKSRLSTNGRCDACLDSDCRTQGPSSRDLPAPDEGLRGRYQPYASQCQHQPAAGRRARRRMGCVHRFTRATCRPGGDQGADRARLPQAGGCRKSARIIPGPNRAVGRRRRDSQLRDVENGRRSRPILADMFRKSVVCFAFSARRRFVCLRKPAP
jgi:hypothetical protein